MLAYVRLVQAKEKELGVDVLTHQKWSGAGYVDGMLGSIVSGSSGSKSMGEGNTEHGMFFCILSVSVSVIETEICADLTWCRILNDCLD